MKNKHIDTYTTVYPVYLVVANEAVTLEDLKKDFVYSDKAELDENILDCQCSTSKVYNKKTNRYCMLVKFNHRTDYKDDDKTTDLINTVAHEAGHVVLDIYDFIEASVDINNQEPFTYELGYIAECIYKTLIKK